MNVKIMKLMNGEEVMADVVEENKEIVLESPAKIMLFRDEDEGMGMALIPWLPYSDEKKVSIKKEHILISSNPTQDILNEYNSKFGSGIVAPPSDLIL